MIRLLVLAAALAVAGPAPASQPPMADVHIHFNWDHEELISAAEAVRRLRENDVVLAVVTATPSLNARKLREVGGKHILPILSPYTEVLRRQTWYVHEDTPVRMRAALEQGGFFGIGEVHLVAGFGPRHDNPVFLAILDLAREFDLPFMIHTDSSDHRYFEAVCRKHSDIRFQWAHAGGQLDAQEVGALMASCPNVWTELSARDPWHYGYLVDKEGRLLPGWIEVMERFPDRFMTGTDPVWNAQQMYRWYEADEGWDHYAQLNRWHRQWIGQLPEALQDKVRLTNALQFYRRETQLQ